MSDQTQTPPPTEFDGINMTASEILAFLLRNQGNMTIIKRDDPNFWDKVMDGVTPAEV